uniref:ACT domain-containing protein n=1 Tax=Heterorhabditis bacteriophora TaxID=37862 RepID=A0A1I7WZV0_HETBA
MSLLLFECNEAVNSTYYASNTYTKHNEANRKETVVLLCNCLRVLNLIMVREDQSCKMVSLFVSSNPGIGRAAQSLVGKLSAISSDFEPLAGVFASMGSDGYSMEM